MGILQFGVQHCPKTEKDQRLPDNTCGTLQSKVGVAASTLSHHLKLLREVGLISQERQATTLICRANYPAMNLLIGYLVDECCADAACGARSKAA